MMESISNLIFALFIIAIGSVVLFTFLTVIRRFILTSFSPKETAALALVSFLLGIMLEAYLVADFAMEAFSAVLILIVAAWLSYRAIKRGWVYTKAKEDYKGVSK